MRNEEGEWALLHRVDDYRVRVCVRVSKEKRWEGFEREKMRGFHKLQRFVKYNV